MTNLRNTTRMIAPLVAAALCAGSAFAQTATQPAKAKVERVSVQAEQPDLLRDLGSAERIQRSGSLRMLSQRISATVCNRAAGIAVDDADKYLKRSIRDYRRILAGLKSGDPGLGLYGPEKDRIVLRTISEIDEIWAPLDYIFNTVEADALTFDHAVEVASIAPGMLESSKQLVGVVAAEYSDPSQMLQSDAILLQISERQRMLEQEIANATCMIGDGIQVEAAQDKLKEAVALYEVSLAALRNGMPEAGVAAPPTRAIDLWLGDISERWSAVRPVLDTIGSGGTASKEQRELVFVEMNKLTWMMNITVQQYTEANKLKYWTGGAS
jgi:hypothetical protein